jgi:hypothetical protein
VFEFKSGLKLRAGSARRASRAARQQRVLHVSRVSQQFSQSLRQLNGRSHTMHIFTGRFAFAVLILAFYFNCNFASFNKSALLFFGDSNF